jgi:predicted ester cyclase
MSVLNKKGDLVTAEDNKGFIRRFIKEVINKQDLANYSEFVGDTILDYGADHLKQFFTAFPDAQANILDVFGEGDKMVARLDITGTNTGSFAGQPPMGNKVNFLSFRIYQIIDNKIVESWAMQDRLGLMEQLGFVQSTSNNVNWGSVEEE